MPASSNDEPEELYAAAQVVNIACGGHAGDERSMTRVLAFCKRFGTRAGAHPSYPDRANFGRVAMAMTPGGARGGGRRAVSRARVVRARRTATCRRVREAPRRALSRGQRRSRSSRDAALKGIIEALGWEITVIGPPARAR